jgi:hypothetical protein
MANNHPTDHPTRVITGPDTRWSYAHVWVPKAIDPDSTPKYSVSLLIPKTDTAVIAKIKKAIQIAYEEGAGKLKGNGKTVPPLASFARPPLHDGDLERPDDPAYANCYFVNASSPNQPGIVDASRQPILDHDEVYSGVYGRASIAFFAYNRKGGKGIGCALNNLQKIRDGEPLGAHLSAEDDFAAWDDDDDFLN